MWILGLKGLSTRMVLSHENYFSLLQNLLWKSIIMYTVIINRYKLVL